MNISQVNIYFLYLSSLSIPYKMVIFLQFNTDNLKVGDICESSLKLKRGTLRFR